MTYSSSPFKKNHKNEVAVQILSEHICIASDNFFLKSFVLLETEVGKICGEENSLLVKIKGAGVIMYF